MEAVAYHIMYLYDLLTQPDCQQLMRAHAHALDPPHKKSACTSTHDSPATWGHTASLDLLPFYSQ